MIRQRVSLAVAGAFVASSAFTLGLAAPASAATSPYDPAFVPTTGDLVGGGSDTSEIAVDYLAKGTNGTPGFNDGKSTGRIASYAATGDPTTLTLRDGSTLARPKNSGEGRNTLAANNNVNFDFARSSSAINTTEQATLRQLPFAVDGLKLAVSSNVASNAPASISEADLVKIYRGDVTNWSQIGGKSGVIKPLIPFAGSGTRKFFEDQLTRINGTAVTPAPSVTEVQEHSVDAIQNDPNAVAPFSTGRAASAKSIKLLGGFAAFCAWAAWELVDESLLFDAHDNSALRVPLVLPQGLWAFGIIAFCAMIAVLLLESLLALLAGRPEELDRLLGSRTLEDETAEALEAVEMAREGGR